MSEYTTSDYRKIFSELELKEQKSQKEYNEWYMNIKMRIQSYNKIVVENNLQDEHRILDDSDEAIDNIALISPKDLFTEIVQRKKLIAEEIELRLGLRKDNNDTSNDTTITNTPPLQVTQQSETTTVNVDAQPKESEQTWDIGGGFNFGFESENPFNE